MKRLLNNLWLAMLSVLLGQSALAADQGRITFKKVVVDPVFHSEGVAVADFDGDGRKDIAAGSVYYSAPDWKVHAILDQPKSFKPEQYSDVFACFADDINRDGRPDLIVVDMPGKPSACPACPPRSGPAVRRD